MLDDAEMEAVKARIEELSMEHRDLDDAIRALQDSPSVDHLKLRRLKKRKLQLKDSLSRLRSQMIPDLDA